MAKYSVRLKTLAGHTVPPLLLELAAWLKQQRHGSLGWFDVFGPETISKHEGDATRLRKHGFAFLSLPEGSVLALIDAGEKSVVVVLLGSEGDRAVIANSFEAFVLLWSTGKTGIDDLDDEDGDEGRVLLAKWLKTKKVKAPKAKDFDFQAWLDGGAVLPAPAVEKAAEPTVTAPTRKPTAILKRLGPKTQEVASLLGLRVDDSRFVHYVSKLGAKKVPQSTSEMNAEAKVEARKAGIWITATHDIRNEAYPPIHKTARAFVPYVSAIELAPEFIEPVLGVSWIDPTEEDITKRLGPGTPMKFLYDTDERIPEWTFALDDGAKTELRIWLRTRRGKGLLTVRMSVSSAKELDRFDRLEAGLFIAWAATNNLLDESRLAKHADLVRAIKQRKAQGTALFDALGRGLWDVHLRDADELRTFAYCWFKNIGGRWITADLKALFGERKGPHGHDEPIIDDDTWDAVDKASKVFSERFARWL